MSILCCVPVIECVYCLGCSHWLWKKCMYSAGHESESWGLATSDEFDPIPRLCRLILAVYEEDLHNPMWAPPGGYGLDPHHVILKKDYDQTQGRVTPYMIYLDHDNDAVVLAIRGLNLAKESDYALLLDNKLGQTKFDGGYVHNGLLKAAMWVFEEEHEVLNRLLEENPSYSLTFVGHSLGAGVVSLLVLFVLQNRGRLGNIERKRIRCVAIAHYNSNMASSKFSSIITILFICTLSLSFGSISCKNDFVTNQAALFVFGDSLFEAGNNNYFDSLPGFKSNYWPYGKTTFQFPTGRVSDGRIMIDFIAEDAWLPLLPPNLQPGYSSSQLTYGLNFATTAAGVFAATFPGVSKDLGTQLSSFKNATQVLRSKLGDAEARRVISKAVYLFHIGANDYQYPFFANTTTITTTTKERFVDFVIGNTTNVIEELYKMGARKFGFLSLGPYGCTPSMSITDPTKIGSCFEPVSELINLHNQEFPKVLRRLERQLSGFKYSLHDFHTSLLQRINNPSQYGFKQGKMACCGSGPLRGVNTCGFRNGPSQTYQLCDNADDYIFFDPGHLTEKAHGQIAELIWSGSSNVTAPYNLKTLFGL